MQNNPSALEGAVSRVRDRLWPGDDALFAGRCGDIRLILDALGKIDTPNLPNTATSGKPFANDVKEHEGYAPCSTCGQYSHTLDTDQITDAILHFKSMYSHRGDGIPTQFNFDERTRDMAQVLVAAARARVAENKPTPDAGHLERKDDLRGGRGE